MRTWPTPARERPFAALEHVHVEAQLEREGRGFEPDRAGADDGERMACGLGQSVLQGW